MERGEDGAERPWWQQGERVAALLGVVVIVGLLSWPLIVGARQRARDQATATAVALAAAVSLATSEAQSTATAEQRSTAAAQTSTAQSAATQAAVALGITQTAAVKAALDATTVVQLADAVATTQAVRDAAATAQVADALAATQAALDVTATALAIPASTPTPAVPALVAGALETVLIPVEEIEPRRTSYSALVASYRLLRQETFDSPQTKSRWNEDRNDPAAPRRFSGSYQLTVSPSTLANSDFWREKGLAASYIVELDVSLPTPGTWAGILFDAAGDGSADRTFAVSDAGTWQLITRRSGQADSALTTIAQLSGAIRGASQINTLRVVRLPNEIQLWVSNTPVAVIPVDGTGGGQVGVMGLADGRLAGPAIVHVDNFKIWEP